MKNQLCGRDEDVFDLNDQDLRLSLPWQKIKLLHIFPVAVLLLDGMTIIIFFSFPKNMSKEPRSLYTAFKIFFFVYIDCIFQIMLQLYRLA